MKKSFFSCESTELIYYFNSLQNDFLLLNGVNAATLITHVILVLIHKYFHLQN